jgi:phosphopantothenoylcysteine decarboxylase/phosphopantothenate--cysteine ligase
MLYGKSVLLGVSGGIAAYKACEIVSSLVKLSAEVDVIMTNNATEFVTPLTFESLSGREAVTDTFKRKKEWEIEHISLARKASVMVIAPATANVIGKFAGGIADDMLTTTYMACKAPKIICPAMNTAMYEDVNLQANLEKLRSEGAIIIEPTSGRLACGDIGLGKLADPAEIVKKIIETIMPLADYADKTVLVTAGATRENIDGVRFISNNSSGKMGMAIARAAVNRGARVILVAGYVTADIPKGVDKIINVKSTEDMYKAVMDNYLEADVIIKAAAPADYTIEPFNNKVKSPELTLKLSKTVDIAGELGKVKGDRKLIVFAAETDDLLKNAQEKLLKKNADVIIANDVTKEGAGFDTDTNIVTIIKKDGSIKAYPKMSKLQLSDIILDTAL